MKRCFIVLAEPGSRFLGVHHTIDGAVHYAAGLGAATMPNGRPITVDDVAEWMKEESAILLGCPPFEDFESIQIERHAIMV